MLDKFLDTLAEWLGVKLKPIPVPIPVRHNNDRTHSGRNNKSKTK